jgi:hypothetical protein
MREAAREALDVLRHEVDEQMEHLQYRHFPSRAQQGVEVVVLPAGDRDCIGCFTDQVKLTCALVWDLDEVMKEVKWPGEHGEEASQKITELEALCKRLREDAQMLKEEKTKLEGMVESHDEFIMEIAKETGLDHMGEDAEDEDLEENEDDDDGGDTTAPPTAAPSPVFAPPAAAPSPVHAPPAATHEVIIVKDEDPVEMVPEQEGPVAHEVILVDVEPELS